MTLGLYSKPSDNPDFISVTTTTTESPSQGGGCGDKFICADGNNCIARTMYCDGFADCPDLSDEPENCG